MALTATMYHLEVDLSDVDRNFYGTLDLRLALHPSETVSYLLARVIAYCLFYEDGIAFSKGLSTADEPAVWVKDARGDVKLWIDVGSPSAERLHKAAKLAERVVVVTHQKPAAVLEKLSGHGIFCASEIDLFALAPSFLAELEPRIGRRSRFALVRHDGTIYVNIEGQSLSTPWEGIAIEQS